MGLLWRWCKQVFEAGEHAHFAWGLLVWAFPPATGIYAGLIAWGRHMNIMSIVLLAFLCGFASWVLIFLGALLWRAVRRHRKIPLHEAARLAFEALEGGVTSAMAGHAFFAPRGPLRYMAMKLYHRGVDIYGKQLPSTVSRLIDDSAFFAGEISADAKTIANTDGGAITHTDLTVEREAVRAAIKELVAKEAEQLKPAA
jgi:hypothetical protein